MADAIIAIVPFLSPGATGNQDITSTTLGGRTPKACIIIGGASGDNAETVDARYSIGFAVPGVTQIVVSTADVDNSAASDNYSRSRNTDVLRAGNNVTGFNLASVNSFIANGVRLNWSARITGRRYYAILFAGSDVQAAVGTLAPSAGVNPSVDVNTLAFSPDAVFLASAFTTANDTNVNLYGVSWGCALSNGTQRVIAQRDNDNIAAGPTPSQIFRNDSCVAFLDPLDGSNDWNASLGTFDATGFTYTVAGTTAAAYIVPYLALKFGGALVDLRTLVAATTTGLHAVTGLGFSPGAIINGTGQVLTANASVFDAPTACGMAIGAADKAAFQAQSTRIRENSDPSDTAEFNGPYAVIFADGGSTTTSRAELDSFDIDGFTLDYIGAGTGAALGWVFSLEDQFPAPPPMRASQHAMLVLAQNFTSPRTSQHAMLVMTANVTVPRVSQQALLVLGDRQPCGTKRAQLWKIARKDGEVFTFTGHDRPITYGPFVYSPCGSLNPSASQSVADLESMSNQELSGIISDDKIREADILAGLFDDAYVEVFLVSWEEVDGGIDSVRRLMAGWVGEISTGEKGFHMEVLGPGARLAQRAVTRVVTPSCDWELGDEDCEVDVDALTLTGEVISVSDDGFFRVSLSSHTTAAQYDMGYVLWIDGPNAGARTDIKSCTFGDGSQADILLWAPAPFMPEVGDQVEVRPGCDKTAPTCLTVYGNKLNFGGFDQVPGNDDIAKTPDASY